MDVLKHPNPALRQPADPVDPESDTDLATLVKRMAQAMYDAPGIGLAATQLGIQKRVVVFDLEEGLQALCNPVITVASDETAVDDEGCLSLPGISVPIARSVRVVCEAQTIDGEPLSIQAQDLLARLLQHEIDHLDGKLIIDRASPEERREAIRRYNDILEGRAQPDEAS